MTDRLAATALRLLAPRANAEGPGDHDSLENVITDELPNGSLCWVVATEGLYRLDKDDNVSLALPGIVIVPLGGPGRWILLASGNSQSQLSAEIFLTATDLISPNFTVTVPPPALPPGTWVPGPSAPEGPAIYTPAPLVSPVFTYDLFAGTMTYLGPERRYLLQTYATMRVDSGSIFLLGLTANVFDVSAGTNDRIGAITNDGTEGITSNVGPPATWFVAAARSVVLAPGDVVRPAITDINLAGDGSIDLIVRRLHLVATPFE
jgi:hypothetical protein